MVTGGSLEDILHTRLSVVYDRTTNVKATFGEIEYIENGQIVVPVFFQEDVVFLSKVSFSVSYVSGDLEGMEYFILGEGREYRLVFTPVEGMKGSFKISGGGDVLKSNGIFDNVFVSAPKLVSYGYE